MGFTRTGGAPMGAAAAKGTKGKGATSAGKVAKQKPDALAAAMGRANAADAKLEQVTGARGGEDLLRRAGVDRKDAVANVAAMQRSRSGSGSAKDASGEVKLVGQLNQAANQAQREAGARGKPVNRAEAARKAALARKQKGK